MTEFATSRKSLPEGNRRGARREQQLVRSYATVFSLNIEDAQLVMADLAEASGYYAVMPEDATAMQMARAEGRREIFARILSLVGVSEEQREAIRIAALAELQTTNEEQARI